MRPDKLRAVAVIAFWLLIARPASGQEEKKPSWFETISLNGFVSTAYSYNFNRPDTQRNLYRVFDFDDATFKIDVLELSLKKDVAKAGESGFRFDLTAGSSIPRVARSPGFEIGDLDFHQMYLSYVVPLGKGLRLDAGKFITSMGYEVIEGYDAYNDNYSRSFLFGYAIPFTHTGIKASYPFSERFSAMLTVVNGWDNAVDSNTSKSVCAQVGVVPVKGMNLSANVMSGPEKPHNNSDYRNLFDAVGTYSVSDMFTVGINGDYGTEEHSAPDGGTATWDGVAGYARANCTKSFSLSLRIEQFEDRNGIRTNNVPQILREITITPEYRPEEHFVMRGDVRLDKSDQNVFHKEDSWTDTQFTMSMNLLYTF